MFDIELSAAEIDAVRDLVSTVRERYDSTDDPEFLSTATVWAHELPRRLRATINTFRLTEPGPVCVIRGYPLDESVLGPTPRHWQQARRRVETREWEFFFFLCSALLGDPVAWSTQQGARLMHDVLPVAGDETFQLNTCSTAELTWHTEDAFHDHRAEYVGLLCLRNPERTETTVAGAADLKLDDETVAQLFRPVYRIEPDNSHRPHGGDRAAERAAEAQRVGVLFGAPDQPYLRLDPYFMAPTGDADADAAFDRLVRAIDEALTGVVLAPGAVAFIDNFRAVHGRRPFRARYDGRDRWLKRLNITTNLRGSRDSRDAPDSWLIHAEPATPAAGESTSGAHE